MHANTGFRGEAFSQAKRFVKLYADAESVVIPSSSCVAMVRDQYPGLIDELGNESLRKEFGGLLPRVLELSEFLIDKFGQHHLLCAVQVYERVDPVSLAELEPYFSWSTLNMYELNAPGQNHGVLLGTRGWTP